MCRNLGVCKMKWLLIFNKDGSEEGIFAFTCRVSASLRTKNTLEQELVF